MDELDEKFLRRTLLIAARSKDLGNHPFGAILVGPDQKILLEAGNTVVTEKDITGHAELNLVRVACVEYSPDFLRKCTLYASTEPCPMCAGAIYWGNIGRVVFGLSQERLYRMPGLENPAHKFMLPCADVLACGGRKVEVLGPALENEAEKIHEGFWEV